MRLGELCAGYGGLGMAVEEVFGATTAWFSEYDAAPSKILAHHWPTVPNYGDMTRIDWAAIEPVDIISGGTPCQDLSAAGRRAGMNEGTRSNLWVQMREAVAIQRPRYVVWENVRGAFSAEASSSVEQCQGCVGDTADGRVFLRALGRVLGDLSDLGYDCQWRGLRAADVGSCHGRFRVFVLAANRDSQGLAFGRNRRVLPGAGAGNSSTPVRNQEPASAEDADLATRGERRESAPGQAQGRRTRADTRGRSGTPTAYHSSAARRGSEQQHIPAPTGSAAEPRELAGAVATAPDTMRSGSRRRSTEPAEGWGDHATLGSDQGGTNWGEYGPAIHRWERTIGRRAPRPTEPTGRNNGHRLSPTFTEWMMGLPDGWVTDPAIGISRNEQLKACGNGVVPQQAMAALRDMLAAFQELEVAA